MMTVLRIAPAWRRTLMAIAAVVMAFAASSGTGLAQEPGPEELRAGRLGGTIPQIQERFGEPDWVDDDLIGYNSEVLAGIDTIVVAYHDGQENVRSILLVYFEKPVALDDPRVIADLVAEVVPSDGSCETTSLESSELGREVYACQSDALKGVFNATQLFEFGVMGPDGSYNYSVDPTEDDFYEIVVRFGNAAPPDPSAPPAQPTPRPGPPLDDTYPAVNDALDLIESGRFEQGEELSFQGTVVTLGTDDAGIVLQVEAANPDGDVIVVTVISQEDLVGVFPGSFVTVYGVFGGIECDDNGFCSPTIYAIELSY